MHALRLDLRYAVRMAAKKPVFTLIAVLTLALGIGGGTAMFSVVNAVLLRPLPYVGSDRLVALDETNPKQGQDHFGVSYPNFVDWRANCRSYEEMAAYRDASLILTGQGEPARVTTTLTTGSLFNLLGVAPALGRGFTPEEDAVGAEPVALIGHGLWQRRFGGDPGVVGRRVNFNGTAVTVVGVMPAGFGFPSNEIEAWMPLGPTADQMRNRAVHLCSVIGRLKPNVALTQATAELRDVARRVEQQHPGEDPGHDVSITDLHTLTVGHMRTLLPILFVAVLCVLLIACADIAGLLSARAEGMRREIAVRSALGASRGRIIRQVLTESLLLALAGGAGGVALARWSLDLLVSGYSKLIPRADEIAIDGRVLGFALALSLLTGIIFGLLPAFRAARLDLNPVLNESSGKVSASGRRGRALGVLTAVEIALSVVLLVGAGLFVKSFFRLTAVDPGFRPENLLTMTVTLHGAEYSEGDKRAAFFESLPKRLEAVPGVTGVSAVNRLPISGGDPNGSLTVEGRDLPPDNMPAASFRRVLPNYFRTMGIPLKQGREFDDRDRGQGDFTVVVNESLARRFFPEGDAVGKRIKVGPPENEPWLTIVGVVGDTRNIGLDTGPLLATYEPVRQRPSRTMSVVVRAETDPAALAETVRTAIRSGNGNILIDNVAAMSQRITASVADRRLNTLLLGLFASVALTLAVLGVYGVVSYRVAQRTYEIGIRMAVGAQRADVLRLVVGQGMKPVFIGLGIGFAAAFGLTRFVSSLLFEVRPTDPSVFMAIFLVLVAAALAACLIPARRAAATDPVTALRQD